HCSWTFFSTSPSEDEDPSDIVLSLFDMKREGAKVIASSKPIKDDDDNPPHFIAAERYREKVGAGNVLCTGEHPNTKKPEPLYFTMTKNGPVKDSASTTSSVVSSAVRAAAVAVPKTYG